MIAIDTNILVRYFTRDDPTQAERARQLLQEELAADRPGFVSLVTLVEVGWVLGQVYKVSSAEIRAIVAQLLDAPEILIEQSAVVERALALKCSDLADAIIHEAGRAAGCERTLTFDRAFARLAGVELLKA